MDFKPEALKPLSKTYTLKNIAVVDIETEKWAEYEDIKDMDYEDIVRDYHKKPLPPFLIGFYNHVTKDEKLFDGKHAMRDFLKYYLVTKGRQHRNLTTFAHYGGGFDFTALFDTLSTESCFDRFIPHVIYVNGGTLLLRIKDKNKNMWRFRDSSYLLKDGLPALCKAFNPSIKKLKMPEKPENMHYLEFYERNRPLWQRYCMNDCISLALILEKFNDIITNQIGGCIGLTASSTALRTWRRKFQKYPIPTYFTWNDFIRLGYYGGRCEVLNMCSGKAFLYDVKSMYPSVMVNNIFPMSTPERVNMKDAWDCKGKCGFMECKVETPKDMYIPLLPYRHPESNKLLFPLGKWTGVYEFSLIEKALENGYKIKPYKTLVFDGDYLFSDYVKTLYPYKENNKGNSLESISKLLLNGLYGKFGEKSKRPTLITDAEADLSDTYPIMNNPFGYTIKETVRYSAHHLPAISARVTALAQIRLWEKLNEIYMRGHTVYYMDTDSVITDLEMPYGRKLGEWDLKTTITRGIYFIPKGYCYEYYDKEKQKYILEQKFKGYSRKFTKTLEFENYFNALPPKNDYSAFYEPSIQPASFKELSTRELPAFGLIVKNRRVRKGYDKRTILENYDTEPLLISNL